MLIQPLLLGLELHGHVFAREVFEVFRNHGLDFYHGESSKRAGPNGWENVCLPAGTVERDLKSLEHAEAAKEVGNFFFLGDREWNHEARMAVDLGIQLVDKGNRVPSANAAQFNSPTGFKLQAKETSHRTAKQRDDCAGID